MFEIFLKISLLNSNIFLELLVCLNHQIFYKKFIKFYFMFLQPSFNNKSQVYEKEPKIQTKILDLQAVKVC